MEPKVRKLDGLIQLRYESWYTWRSVQRLLSYYSYNLPHRVFVARAYPLRSPNGSTIIAYGHDSGLRLVWRGGLPLKSAGAQRPAHLKANGATSDDPMTTDLDDDDPPSGSKQPHQSTAEFKDENEEYDPLHPYEPVIQTLDLPFGTKVLHLSFLHLSTELQQSSLGSLPKVLLDKMVVAVACSDCSIRVLTIPLTPPSDGTISGIPIGRGLYGEQMVVLSVDSGHRSLARGISMTLVPTSAIGTETVDGSDYQENSWDLLVASHSAHISGLLLIHRIPLLADGSAFEEDPGSSQPWQIQHLASPAITISFNPSPYPSLRHSQLLISNTKGAVSIYDCLSYPKTGRGSWLISLHPGSNASNTDAPQRKEILTALWVLGGKAVAVLLFDGEWGIWDLEDGAPKIKKGIDGWQGPVGVSLAGFTISGWIADHTPPRETSKTFQSTEARPQLAPMTPATRKVRQETLFAGPVNKAGNPTRGGMSVCSASDGLDYRKDDETLLLWLGNAVVVIPSLLTHWQNRMKGSGNLFGSGAQGQPNQLNNVHLKGEVRNDVSLITPQPLGRTRRPSKQSNILVTGERRIVIVGPPLLECQPLDDTIKPKPRARSTAADQVMLARGELDVEDIDRALARMSNGHQLHGPQVNVPQYRKRNDIPMVS